MKNKNCKCNLWATRCAPKTVTSCAWPPFYWAEYPRPALPHVLDNVDSASQPFRVQFAPANRCSSNAAPTFAAVIIRRPSLVATLHIHGPSEGQATFVVANAGELILCGLTMSARLVWAAARFGFYGCCFDPKINQQSEGKQRPQRAHKLTILFPN